MSHISEQGLGWILKAAEKDREQGDEGVQDKIQPKKAQQQHHDPNQEDMKVKELTLEEQE